MIVRHHIDYDKYNNILDNLCALTPKTHALVTNESGMSKDEYMKTFQEGKENLKQKIPPEHWYETNKEDYKSDMNQENNQISENYREEQREDPIDEGDTKESDISTKNSNNDNKDEILKDSKEEGDKNENQAEEKANGVKDKESEESVEEDLEILAEETEGTSLEEGLDEIKEDISKEQVLGEPTERQQETQNKMPSDNLSNEFSGRLSEGIVLVPLEQAEDEKEKPKDIAALDDINNQSYTLTSGREYGGIKRSTDYDGIDEAQRDKGSDFKGIDEDIDERAKDYSGLEDNAIEGWNDFDGIDSPQEKQDRDYDNIDEGYGESGNEGL